MVAERGASCCDSELEVRVKPRALETSVSSQSDDDARRNVGRPPRRGETTCRDGPATILKKETLRTVTMANEVARLNKPTGFIGDEDEYGDWDFALTCFVGTMDGTLLKQPQAVASDPRVKRTPRALQHPGTDDKRQERWYERH